MDNPEKQDKSKKGLVALVALVFALFVSMFLASQGYYSFGVIGAMTDTQPATKTAFTADKNAGDADTAGKTKDEIVADLNEKVENGMINISMNTNPVFENGAAKGTLMITNNKINRYSQQVEIYTKDTNTLVYSGGVNVGQQIETSTLAVDLPAGTYDCVAYFNAIDTTTGEHIGTAGANIIITVLS